MSAHTNCRPHHPKTRRTHPRRVPHSDYLLYGRLYVPTSRLDALYSTRLSSTLQALVAAISDPRADLKQSQSTRTASSPSNIMFNLQHDTGRWCTEYTYSAEDSMLGIRLLHNFGKLAPTSTSPSGSTTTAALAVDESERSATSRGGTKKRIDEEDAMEGGLKGRISAGAEVYFSAKEKSAGGPCPFITVLVPLCTKYSKRSLIQRDVWQCRPAFDSPRSRTPHHHQSRHHHHHHHFPRSLPPPLPPLPPFPNRRPRSPHSSTR